MVNRWETFSSKFSVVFLMNMSRVLRDDPSKSDMHNREGLGIKMIWGALIDWQLWPLYVLGLVHFST